MVRTASIVPRKPALVTTVFPEGLRLVHCHASDQLQLGDRYMIQRRTLLQSGAAVALGAPALVGFAQQSVTLKFHTFMAPQSNVWLNMHKAWMTKVEKDSGGRIKFEGYPAMQLGGSPVQLFDQARDGVVDIVWTLPGNTAGRFPRVEVFELPFMMNNAEATSKAYWDYVQTMAPDEFKDVHVL